MEYVKVYEVPIFQMNFIIPSLIALIGFAMPFIIFKLKNSDEFNDTEKSNIFARIFAVLLVAGYLFGLGAFVYQMFPVFFRTTLNHLDRVKNKNYEVVEGSVENFTPMPYGGHAKESFYVNGAYFEYSDYEITGGFNNTASHGGPIKGNGQKVRISYYSKRNRSNIILILETEKKDDSASLWKKIFGY